MILITGANGLLAANVIPLLIGNGHCVRGLVRPAAGYKGAAHPNLEIVEGDFTSDECLRRVLPGCDAVIHLAAVTSRSGRSYDEYYEVNVKATRRLVESAIGHGVRRFVAIASSDVFGYGSREIPGCELNEMCEPFASSYYSRSKYEGLRAAMSYGDRIEVVAVAPTHVIGPHDCKPGWGRIVTAAYGKKLIFHPPGGKNFVHAGDAALGIVRALERGTSGETYLLCSENLTYKEFYKTLGAVTGNRALYIRIPRLPMYIAGGVGSFLRVMGLRTRVSLPNMRILCVPAYYHNYKAARDLGVAFRPAADAVRDAVEWFVSSGMLKSRKNG